jgi:cytoskeletal protein CcmA (bactofilin family)
MFGGSKSTQDEKRTSNASHLTGLERAKLERSTHSDEPQNQAPPQSPQARPAPMPATVVASARPIPVPGSEAHLYAGPGITLKGEITGCDTLRVEGMVDGNATARKLILCPGGSFLGTAEIDEAEIEGNFDGTLNVHGMLLLRGNGRITGTLSYGQIEIERGGEIAGQITPYGKPSGARERAEAPFGSVPNERRALVSAPKPAPQSFYESPRPASRVKDAVTNFAAPAQPASAVRREQTAAPNPVRAAEPPAKARKVLFFGRN